MSLITIDLTDRATLAASVAALGVGMRERLAEALRAAGSVENDAALLREIREVLAEDCPWLSPTGHVLPYLDPKPTPIGVLFSTAESDNGYFLTPHATVLFDYGHTEHLDFGDAVEDMLTEEYGRRSAGFSLAVDLRTDLMDLQDTAEGTIHERFGVRPDDSDRIEEE